MGSEGKAASKNQRPTSKSPYRQFRFSCPALWRLSLPGSGLSYWSIYLMISQKRPGDLRSWCVRIRPKWRKYRMISICWRPYLSPTYIPEDPLSCDPAGCCICCGYFFLDTQWEFIYISGLKKQVLINYQLNLYFRSEKASPYQLINSTQLNIERILENTRISWGELFPS